MPAASTLALGRTVRVYFRGKTHGGKQVGICEGQKMLPLDGAWPIPPKQGDVWRVKLVRFLDDFWIGTPVEREAEGTTHRKGPQTVKGRQSKPPVRQSPQPGPPRRREIITFYEGDGGEPITRIDGKISFPCNHGGWDAEPPQIGETWEVEILRETKSKTAFILRGIRKVE